MSFFPLGVFLAPDLPSYIALAPRTRSTLPVMVWLRLWLKLPEFLIGGVSSGLEKNVVRFNKESQRYFLLLRPFFSVLVNIYGSTIAKGMQHLI